MTRLILALAAMALLSGCVKSGGTPVAAMVSSDRVVVRMNTGWPCVGFREDGTETDNGWSGTLQGCPAEYPYVVRLEPGSNPVRLVLQEVFGALGAADVIRPLAEVEITKGKGKSWVFQSPPPAED